MSAHGCRFSFTPLTAVLFTFPSRYLSTIGHQNVFSLIPWSGRVHAKFHVHRVTQGTARVLSVFGYGSFTLWGAAFHPLHLTVRIPYRSPTTPGSKLPGLGSSVFARHYLRNHARFLLLRLLRCFTSAGIANFVLPSPLKGLQTKTIVYYHNQVIPFGNLRIKVYLPLPEAYRSLSRPSSPFSTKASTVCPLKLDFFRILLFPIATLASG